MKILKTMSIVLFLVVAAGLLGACGGGVEPPASTGRPIASAATAQPNVTPTLEAAKLPTATPSPTAKATLPQTKPSPTVPAAPPETATPTPAGPPPAKGPTPKTPTTVAVPDTAVPTATFTPPPPTVTPAPTIAPPSCSASGQRLSGSAGRVVIVLSGESIGRFRVREQFARISLPSDAVGETRKVSGSLVFDGAGSVLSGQSKITVDLLSLMTDDEDRDDFLRENSLESARFPLAELVVRETPGLPWPIPCQGEVVFEIAGDMTVHGVTAPLTWEATVQFRPDSAKGLMKTNFPFSKFGMKKPKKLFLLSVEDNIRLELQFEASISSSP